MVQYSVRPNIDADLQNIKEKYGGKKTIHYSTRDTSLPSDLDLALSAADEIAESGGDEYWASLLESDPGIAGEAKEIKRLGKQLKKTEADLAEARRNLTLTDRKLKTRGIASLAATIMQDQKAGDVNHAPSHLIGAKYDSKCSSVYESVPSRTLVTGISS